MWQEDDFYVLSLDHQMHGEATAQVMGNKASFKRNAPLEITFHCLYY